MKEGLNPKFEVKISELLELAKKEGLSVGLFEGYRSMRRQAELYAQGRVTPGNKVTWSKPGYSFHNYGLAADIVFKDSKGAWSWAEGHDWEKLGNLGKSLGLEWGGDWKGKRDRPHFQMTHGVTLQMARDLFARKGLAGVWEKI